MRIDLVLNQHAVLGYDHPYIKHVIHILNDLSPVDFNENDFAEYSSLMPDDLYEACRLHLEVEFELNTTLLLVLLYHTLANNPDPEDIIAVTDFLLKETIEQNEDVSQTVFDKSFEKLFEQMDGAGGLPSDTLLRLNNFIEFTPYDISQHIQDIVIVLRLVVGNNYELIDDYQSPVGDDTPAGRVAFMALKVLFNKGFNDEDMTNLFTLTLTSLCMNDGHPTRMDNIMMFFKHVLKGFASQLWFKNAFLRTMITVKDPTITVKLLKLCDKDDYVYLVRALINSYVEASEEEDRMFLLEVMSYIICEPYSNEDYDDHSRQKIVNRIVRQVFCRLALSEKEEKETILTTFVEWYEWRDINLRRTLQQMFNVRDGEDAVTAKKLLLMAEEGVDLHWENESYNILFIKLTLNMFYCKPDYMVAHLVKIIEVLCFKAMAAQVEPCLPYLVKVIHKYADKKMSAIKPLLGILIHFALVPTQIGKKFLTEIHNLVKSAMSRNEDAESEFGVLQILMSPNLHCRRVLAALDMNFPITQEQLMVLFEERTLKHRDTAWPYLCILLDKHELTTFPAHFPQYLTELDQAQFYQKPEATYVIQTINKIFCAKKKNNLTQDDKALAAQVFNVFSKHIMRFIVTNRVANEVISLITFLSEIIEYECPKLSQWKKATLLDVIDKFDDENVCLVARKLTYLSHFVFVSNMEIPEEDREKVENILALETNDIAPTVLAKLILFYGRISVKFNYKTNETITFLTKFVSHTDMEVQVMTLTTMFDISKIRLHHFTTMDDELIKLLSSPSLVVQDAALKLLLQLLGKDQLRLNLEGTIAFLLAIVDRNINTDIFLRDVNQKEQLLKNDKVIKAYFPHLVFYLNGYTEVQDYVVKMPTQRNFSYEHRCMIYCHLFEILQRPDQLSILHVLALEFIDPLYNGTLNLSYNGLMTLKDCFNLVSYYAMENIEHPIFNTKKFYEKFMPKVQTLLTVNYNVKSVVTEFNQQLGIVVRSLLQMLCKIEKAAKEMLPQVYNTIALLTTAYYDNILTIVNDNSKLRDLYCVYDTFFVRHRTSIISEPLSAKMVADRTEWDRYVRSEL